MQPGDSHNVSPRLTWLPGEVFRFALDAKEGLLNAPSPSAVLTVTSRRVITFDRRAGRRATTMTAIGAISAVEVVEVSRPAARLWQGLVLLGAGLLLAWVTWMLFSAALITVLVGGLPMLMSVYVLLDFALPNARGELTLHAPGVSIRCPLRSDAAQRDAYAAAHRLLALQAGVDLPGAPEAPGAGEEAAAPDAPEPETAPPTADAVAETALDAPSPAPPARRPRRARRRSRRGIRAMRRARRVRLGSRGRVRAERLRRRKRAAPMQPQRAPSPGRRRVYVRRRLLRRLRLAERASAGAEAVG